MKRKISVIASHASSLDGLVKAELATYACDDCANHTITVAGAAPFCVHCSSENTNEVEQVEASLYELGEEELSSVTCPHCSVANIIPDVELAALEGKMGCVTCGTELTLDVSGYDMDEESMSDDDEMSEMEDEAEMEESSLDDVDVKDDDNSMSEDEPDEDTDAEASVEEELAGSDKDDMDEEEDDKEDEVASTIESDVDVPESTQASILDIVVAGIDEESTANVEFIPYGDKVLALVNDVHVATATKTEETANADIFGNSDYMQALATTFETAGLEATLEEYDFVLSSIDVSGEVISTYAQEKASSEVAANLEETLSGYQADLQQSVEIAATGLNRNFFTEHSHVVKERLVQDLTAAGVRNAQNMVDTAFAETEDQHTATIFEIASNLVGRSRDSRNDLSDVVAQVRAPIATKDDVQASVETSLEQPFKPQITTANLVQHNKPKQGTRVREIASNRGGLFTRRR